MSDVAATAAPPPPAAGDVAWVMTGAALVFIMIPGLGYFYAGMARDKNALSLMLISLLSLAIVLLQWFVIGYSLAFSTTGGPFIGDGQYAFLMHVGADQTVAVTLPNLAFCIFQCMFAAITPALAVGAVAERFSLIPTTLFMLIWTTIVYDPIAYWTWGANGWLNKLGVLDFAGGTPIEVCSGFAGLGLALAVGKRRPSDEPFKPHSMSSVILGTALLWFGWLGFNSASALAANARAALVLVNTNLAGAAGGMTWLVIDYVRDRRVSALGFCTGAVAGLVAITPACGFMGPAASIAVGFLAGVGCNYASRWKHALGYDDTLDAFSVHGIGGVIGLFFTGVFAEKYWIGLDGTDKPGGALSGHPMQIVYQMAAIGAGAAWSFTITYLIAFVMDKIGLSLRVSAEAEDDGIDHSQMGEYTFDYVGDRISSSVELKRISSQVSREIQAAPLSGSTAA
ncbi:ammonium transporter [Allomyces macrogynus ATCC 38327]|uniref:Ammonium transporter n=1 Tax=Allomyces macrogynus (strain ATCC 38327) TaxID=578462 RepID=A0A0L0STS6_ALLM3|nr:ammonium transporter [Allomyces macrogynus ATCC 38327]|eukprot:KNE65932.1 ammonium transporter [Allomyces macrogynus ATCC 38327]